MILPKIASSSDAFVKYLQSEFTPSAEVVSDQRLISEINKMWSDGISFINSRANIPRSNDWLPPYNSHILRPYKFGNTSQSLTDICNHRARSIILSNRPIKAFWSGGIDSTLVVASLLDNLSVTSDLTIYHTCESIAENPDFVDHIKKFNIKMEVWSDAWETPFLPDELIVTGTTADQLTASVDESFYLNYKEWLQKPWQDYFVHRGMSSIDIENFEQKLLNHENSIVSTLEARWYFYFIIRHQFWVTKDWHLNFETGIGKNVVCFFDCYEFDNWSQINRNEFFLGSNWQNYKQAFKDEIFKRWPNTNYKDNKTKTNSFFNQSWIRIKNSQFGQQHLFTYKSGQDFKMFTPNYWPLMSYESIKEDLAKIENEF